MFANPTMGCATDTYRTSVGLFVSTLMQILQKRATKAAKRARQQKLQAIFVSVSSAHTSFSPYTRRRGKKPGSEHSRNHGQSVEK